MKNPKVVELFGLPYAGKTTHARKLVRKLGHEGLLVKMVPDQFWEAPILKSEFEKDEWCLGKLYTQIIEHKNQELDFVIVERGPWAQLASLKTHLKVNKKISQKAKKAMEEAIVLASNLTRLEDFLILVDIEPETSLRRDRELTEPPQGKILNRKFLFAAKQVYLELIKDLPSGRSLIVSGEEGTFQESQDKILELIKDKKKRKKNSKSKQVNSNH